MRPVAALTLLLSGCAAPSAWEKMADLEREVRFACARLSPGSKPAVWLARVDGRELLAIDADRPVPGASTLKVLILIEAHAQAESGTFRWTDERTLLESDFAGGSGTLRYERPGSNWTYLQLARRMVTESDNTSANLLLERLGMGNVNARAERLGLTVTRFEQPYPSGRRNPTTAREMGRVMRAIYRKEILTPGACEEIARLLEGTSRGRIAAGVPRDVAVGHKGGRGPGLRADAGWVRMPGQPYVLSVYVDNAFEKIDGEVDAGWEAVEGTARAVAAAMGPTDE